MVTLSKLPHIAQMTREAGAHFLRDAGTTIYLGNYNECSQAKLSSRAKPRDLRCALRASQILELKCRLLALRFFDWILG
jgi:hypothetical protein